MKTVTSDWLLEPFFDLSVDMLCVAGADGHFKEVNAAFERVLGYRRDELLARPIIDFVHPDDRAATLAELDKLRGGRTARGFENRYRCKDGTLRWLQWNARTIGDLVYAVARDVTAGKSAEIDRRRWVSLVENSAEFIGMSNLDGGMIFVNDAARRLVGLDDGAVGRMNLRDYLLPEHRPLLDEEVLPTVLASGRWFGEVYFRNARTGAAIPVFWDVFRIDDPTTGRPLNIATVSRDLTLSRQAEEALRSSEARFATIFSQAAVGIAESDRAGRHVLVNERYCQLLGRSREELMRLTVQDVTHPEDLPGSLELFERMLQDGTPFAVEKRYLRPDGTIVWVNDHVSLSRDSRGRPQYAIAIVQDITERKRAEEALRRLNETLEQRVAQEVASRERAEAALRQAQKMEAVGQLTGGIAHDFNNLLTVITGNLELLEQTAGSRKQVLKIAAAARRAAGRGERMTQQLLAFSRRQTLKPQSVNPNRVITEFLSFLRSAAGAAIRVDTALSAATTSCHVDPAQLEVALLNLVVNARDAMPAGGTVTVATRNGSGAFAPFVVVSVSDTGEGMPPDVIERACEPFFTTKEPGRGTGLGLSQVYGFVTQSGGDVEIESEVGEGTQVTLYLPRSAEAVVNEPGEPGARSPARIGESRTVLVVEDDHDARAMAVKHLAGMGYRILEAKDGEEALGILRAGAPIDLLFTDIVMPGSTSGGALARQACRLRPGIRVLLTSGYMAHSLHAFADEFPMLGKPYRYVDLAEKVRAILDVG